MFQYGVNWIAIPPVLYFSLILILGILAPVSIFMLAKGIVKKREKKYFVSWLIVLLISITYFVAIWGVHVIVATNMIGG